MILFFGSSVVVQGQIVGLREAISDIEESGRKLIVVNDELITQLSNLLVNDSLTADVLTRLFNVEIHFRIQCALCFACYSCHMRDLGCSHNFISFLH